MQQYSDAPGIIAVIVALLVVCLSLAGMHAYADRFASKPVILEERSGQPNDGPHRKGGQLDTHDLKELPTAA